MILLWVVHHNDTIKYSIKKKYKYFLYFGNCHLFQQCNGDDLGDNTVERSAWLRNNVCTFLSESQVNFPPFLLEVFLFAPIDVDRSITKIGNGIILLTLYKQEPSIWDSLLLANGKCRKSGSDKLAMMTYRMV